MSWTPRLTIAIPFAIAFVLNLLSLVTYRFHWNPEHVAMYGFLFAAPWVWLIDDFPVPIRNHWGS